MVQYEWASHLYSKGSCVRSTCWRLLLLLALCFPVLPCKYLSSHFEDLTIPFAGHISMSLPLLHVTAGNAPGGARQHQHRHNSAAPSGHMILSIAQQFSLLKSKQSPSTKLRHVHKYIIA